MALYAMCDHCQRKTKDESERASWVHLIVPSGKQRMPSMMEQMMGQAVPEVSQWEFCSLVCAASALIILAGSEAAR